MTERAVGAGDARALDRGTLRRVVAALCLTEITSWGILYYALPVLAPAITRTTGWTLTMVTGAFSAALVTAAVVGIAVGRGIDRFGPRPIMTAGSLLAVPGLVAIATAATYPVFLLAWVVTGAAISALLYPPAFVALTHWGGVDRVRALTVLTLVAGLASTVFAPVTAVLEDRLGWRAAYLVLAGVLGVITVPAHWFGLRAPWVPDDSPPVSEVGGVSRATWWTRPFLVLLVAMCATAVCVYAVVINLVPLLMERGLTTYEAAIALGLGGVGQVCGRLGYGWFSHRTTPGARSVVVFTGVVVTTGLLALVPGPMLLLLVLSMLVGATRGVFTLIQATAVSDRWGTSGFGRLNGVMLAPVMLASALAPWLGSALAEVTGSHSRAFLVLTFFAALAAVLIPWSRPGEGSLPVPGRNDATICPHPLERNTDMSPATPQTPLGLFGTDSLIGEEDRAMRDAVRRFVEERIRPELADWYESGVIPARDLAKELGSLGVLGMHLEGYGCAGTSATAYGLACMELEAGDSGLRSLVSVQGSLAMFAIWKHGSKEQKTEWLPRMAAGEAIGCFGLTEPDFGSNPAGMRTRARRDGDDWILSGNKMWITNGSVADVAVVWAQAEEADASGGQQVRGFVVPTDTPGFSAPEIKKKMSLRASVTSELVLDDVRLPATAMLPEAAGLSGPLSCLNEARYGIVFGALGAARDCLETTIGYTQDRLIFDKPLAAYQLTQAKLADMTLELGKGMLLALHLGALKDAGTLRPEQVSLGKLNNVREAIAIARECRTLLGAAGITLEYPIMRHANNLESVLTYEGTSEVHQLVLGQALTGQAAFR